MSCIGHTGYLSMFYETVYALANQVVAAKINNILQEPEPISVSNKKLSLTVFQNNIISFIKNLFAHYVTFAVLAHSNSLNSLYNFGFRNTDLEVGHYLIKTGNKDIMIPCDGNITFSNKIFPFALVMCLGWLCVDLFFCLFI